MSSAPIAIFFALRTQNTELTPGLLGYLTTINQTE
jgi:hypothetical protein